MGLIDRATEDGALTPMESKSMKLYFHRTRGKYYYLNLHDLDGCVRPFLQGSSEHNIRRFNIDAICIDVMSVLLDIDRGVYVQMNGGQPPNFGFITYTESLDDIKIYNQLWKKKKMLTVAVRLCDVANGQYPNEVRGGEIIHVEPHRLRMVSIRDSRHVMNSVVTQPIPTELEPDEFIIEGDSVIAEGIHWQYWDNNEWINYPKGLACRIEASYSENASHYLYSPGNPHNRDQCSRNALVSLHDGVIPYEAMLRMHDTCTRQIIFEVSSRGEWLSGPHSQTDNMTEKDLSTGMAWRVQRIGGTPRSGGDSDRMKRSYLFEKGMVDWLDTREKCELCFKTNTPLLTLPCCGAKVCDTENQYTLGSYAREGQCMRNHLSNSICGYHFKNKHEGGWKDCKKCEEDFHPYDYAVKATSMHASTTVRRYNFDNNVRTDIHPAGVPFPQCSRCGVDVETTEEKTDTLAQRKGFGFEAMCAGCG